MKGVGSSVTPYTQTDDAELVIRRECGREKIPSLIPSPSPSISLLPLLLHKFLSRLSSQLVFGLRTPVHYINSDGGI